MQWQLWERVYCVIIKPSHKKAIIIYYLLSSTLSYKVQGWEQLLMIHSVKLHIIQNETLTLLPTPLHPWIVPCVRLVVSPLTALFHYWLHLWKQWNKNKQWLLTPIKGLVMQAWGIKHFHVNMCSVLPMSPFSIALMSGLSRQSVVGNSLSIPGSSSFSVMAKLVKLYI